MHVTQCLAIAFLGFHACDVLERTDSYSGALIFPWYACRVGVHVKTNILDLCARILPERIAY